MLYICCSWSTEIKFACFLRQWRLYVYMRLFITFLVVRICRFRRAAVLCTLYDKKNGESQWFDARFRCDAKRGEAKIKIDILIISSFLSVTGKFQYESTRWRNWKKNAKYFRRHEEFSNEKKFLSLFLDDDRFFMFCLDWSEWNFYWRLILSVMATTTTTTTLTLSCLVYTRHTRIASSHYSHRYFFLSRLEKSYGDVIQQWKKNVRSKFWQIRWATRNYWRNMNYFYVFFYYKLMKAHLMNDEMGLHLCVKKTEVRDSNSKWRSLIF